MDRVPAAGETVTGAAFSGGPGGKGSNQAIAARRLGVATDLFSIVGDDDHGRELRALWEAEGVGHEFVLVGRQHTMVGAILVERSGENRIVVAPGVLEELTPDALAVFAPTIESSAALLANLEIPVDVTLAALVRGRAAGVTTVLNPAPASLLPPDAWASIDHLTPNRSEAGVLTRLPQNARPQELADALRRRFAGTIVLTLGAEGVLVESGGVREHIPSPGVGRTVDTTGAGDAFSAAYTVALSEDATPLEAARFAARAGAFTVTRPEVIPALPYRADLETHSIRVAST
jgi:ribokinase